MIIKHMIPNIRIPPPLLLDHQVFRKAPNFSDLGLFCFQRLSFPHEIKSPLAKLNTIFQVGLHTG